MLGVSNDFLMLHALFYFRSKIYYFVSDEIFIQCSHFLKQKNNNFFDKIQNVLKNSFFSQTPFFCDAIQKSRCFSRNFDSFCSKKLGFFKNSKKIKNYLEKSKIQTEINEYLFSFFSISHLLLCWFSKV